MLVAMLSPSAAAAVPEDRFNAPKIPKLIAASFAEGTNPHPRN
jgi:hypothetical protein